MSIALHAFGYEVSDKELGELMARLSLNSDGKVDLIGFEKVIFEQMKKADQAAFGDKLHQVKQIGHVSPQSSYRSDSAENSGIFPLSVSKMWKSVSGFPLLHSSRLNPLDEDQETEDIHSIPLTNSYIKSPVPDEYSKELMAVNSELVKINQDLMKNAEILHRLLRKRSDFA